MLEQTERGKIEEGLTGHKVAKATGNIGGMVRKKEEVQTGRNRRQGTPLCVKIL